METKELYDLWLANASEDADLIEDLKIIAGNAKEINERFGRELSFGTAGLRGILGAGTNRMNIYTVRKTTQGLANYIKNQKSENPSVAISYDSRIKSDLFAMEAARVLAANGIVVYLSEELQPTPVVSYAVRKLHTSAGIMVTASHNPSKYNGYKCYGPDGCQMTEAGADAVYSEMQKIDVFGDNIKLIGFKEGQDSGMIRYISDDLYESYLDEVQKQSVNPGVCTGSKLRLVYTPLNGAGNKLVQKILNRIGITDITVVPEQEMPDGRFPTCLKPNPEEKEALRLGLALAEKVDADLLLATDPDSDRVGIAVKVKDRYRLMTGNETGIMLLNYILSSRKANGTLPENPVAVKTVVTSKLVAEICKKYGCELRNVLTGFKYIGEQILLLEEAHQENRYVFGFEESYGYLAGTYVRDKDAVVASMLICEMAAYYNAQGKSLDEVMTSIYKDFGYYINRTESFEFEGSEGMECMKNIMKNIRANTPAEIAGFKVTEISDYLESYSMVVDTGERTEIKLPKSNVLSYALEGGGMAIVRPSGTEPKIKIYITAVSNISEADALGLADKMMQSMADTLGIERK